jgi:hypothetical protein
MGKSKMDKPDPQAKWMQDTERRQIKQNKSKNKTKTQHRI